MSQQTRTTIQTQIDADIYTNTNNEITGDEVNTSLTNLNESAVNWLSDVESVVNNDPTKVPNSAAVYAVLPGNPVITLSKVAFDALVASNGLRTGYWYLVTSAVDPDPVWSVEWDALVIAETTNTIRAQCFLKAPFYDTEWLKAKTDTDFTNVVLCDTNKQLFTMTATQAASYDGTGGFALGGGVDVVVITNDIYGNAQRYFCKTNSDGTAILNTGRLDSAYVSGMTSPINHVLLFADDTAVPVDPVTVKVSLASGDLTTGTSLGDYDALPRLPSGWLWDGILARYSYVFNSAAYTGLSLFIKSETAALQMFQTKTLDGVTGNYIGRFDEVEDNVNSNQYAPNKKLIIQVNSGTGGNGSINVYITAIACPS
jgi:hypothetical protein